METTYRYTLQSPSGHEFVSLFQIRSVTHAETQERRDITGTIYVGNPTMKNAKEAYVTVIIQYPDLPFAEQTYQRKSMIDPTVASLILTRHYATCAEIIQTTLSHVKQVCPFIERVNLNDSSALPYFYLTSHHKTWYEAKFHATLQTPTLQQEYESRKTDWLSAALEPFEEFQVRYLSKTPYPIQTALEDAYRQSATTEGFFRRLYNTHQVSMTCILLHDWIDEYMRVMGLEQFVKYHKWFIDVG